MKILIVTLTILGCFSSSSLSIELKQLLVIGEPVKDRRTGWPGHINYLKWDGNTSIVFAGRSGFLKKFGLHSKALEWERRPLGEIAQVTANSNSVFLLFSDKMIFEIDIHTGTTRKTLNEQAISKLLKKDFSIPAGIAWLPKRKQLLISDYVDGQNHLVDTKTYKVVISISTDTLLENVFTPSGYTDEFKGFDLSYIDPASIPIIKRLAVLQKR